MLHQGPLPPAELLAEYERVLPGAAERVFTMAETEQSARHEHMRETRTFRRRGQGFAFVVMLGALLVAGIAVVLGNAVEAKWIITAALGSAAVVALTSGRPPKDEKEKSNRS